MSRLNSHRVLTVLVLVFIGWEQADARPFRVSQLPNGSALGCASCHVAPGGGGPLTSFGRDINNNYMTQSGRSGNVQWNAMLAMLDSDGDGVSNGRELGDPDGDGTVDASIQVTNPGDPNSFVQQPPQVVGPSLTIGGVMLQEDVKNPPVPSGMQVFERVFAAPLGVSADSLAEVVKEIFLAFPEGLIDSIAGASDLALSADGLKLTATINLPEGMTYQMFISLSSDIDPVLDSQLYYFGTVELPDAVVSGEAIVPDHLKALPIGTPGVAMVLDLDMLNADAAQPNSGTDGGMDENSGIVRIAPISITESDPPRLFFNIEHVPDGSYGLSIVQEVGAEGEEIALSAFLEIAVVNGEVPPNLRVVLREDGVPEVQEIVDVSVQSVDAANHRFAVQSDDGQIDISVVPHQIDASGTLFVHLPPAGISDFIAGFLTGDLAFIPELVFPFSDLMPGDKVSILGLPSMDGLTALLVIRHAQTTVTVNADFDGDGDVGFSDFLLFVDAFGTSEGVPGYNAAADLDGDGAVAFSDFLIFANAFGKPVG